MIKEYDPLKGKMFQILNSKGKIVNKKYEPKLSPKILLDMYKAMVKGRMCDEKMLKLQRRGMIGVIAPAKGQEAAQIGPAFALKKEDWVIPAFREISVLLHRGFRLKDQLLYFGGEEFGSKISENVNTLPVSIPVGSHPLHAVGMAWASKIRKEKKVYLTFFGDGATSEGDFHEAMNFAGVFQTPTLFLCQNNQWAISVPRKHQTHAETIAQKAVAYGFNGIQVDGNDVLAMYVASKEAIANARKGKGPTLIEAYTYRLSLHTTSDDPTKYRSKKEEQEWAKKDPILRFTAYLKKKKILTAKKEKSIQKEIEEYIAKEMKEFEATPQPKPDEIFDYVFETLTPRLEEQKAHANEMVKTQEIKDEEKIDAGFP